MTKIINNQLVLVILSEMKFYLGKEKSIYVLLWKIIALS